MVNLKMSSNLWAKNCVQTPGDCPINKNKEMQYEVSSCKCFNCNLFTRFSCQECPKIHAIARYYITKRTIRLSMLKLFLLLLLLQ